MIFDRLLQLAGTSVAAAPKGLFVNFENQRSTNLIGKELGGSEVQPKPGMALQLALDFGRSVIDELSTMSSP